MDIRYMRYFVAVAEARNFTHAAESLNTVQPSLSRQIKRLEGLVGTQLFFRNKHEVRLTAAGEIFLRECRAILQQIDQAMVLAREGARAEAGHITIGFVHGTEKLFFDNLFPRLRRKYADMQITFRSFCESELFLCLHDHSVDAAFLNGPFFDPQCATEFFMHQRIVAAIPTSHPLASKPRVPIAKLAELPLVGPNPETWPVFHAYLHRLARDAGVIFRPADSYHDSAVTSLQAVATDVCFSLIPDCRIDIVPAGAVLRPLDLDPEPRIELLLAYRRDGISPVLALFLAVFREFQKETSADAASAGASLTAPHGGPSAQGRAGI